MKAKGSLALVILWALPLFGCAGESPTPPTDQTSRSPQPTLVQEALSLLEVEGPVSIISSEGWWGSGLLHLRDGKGTDIELPYGFIPGEDWCRLSNGFLVAEYPEDPTRAECAWLILLDDWMRREFSTSRITELANYDGRNHLTELEYAALRVIYLLNDPESPTREECLSP